MLGSSLQAQETLIGDQNFGFSVGLNTAFGTHFQRLGINLNFYYTMNSWQANSEVRLYYNFKNLGPTLRYPELVVSQGILYAYGPLSGFTNPFLQAVSNQTGYKNSVAYTFNGYFNSKKTKQQTGTLALQFEPITFIVEDDLLARPSYDRFRTGAFLVQYQYEDKLQVALNCTMWTGQLGTKQNINDPHVYSGCYIDTTLGIYSNRSHGLLSAQCKYYLGASQTAQLNVGVDADQVRNAIQNKMFHDAQFLPKKWFKRKNCYMPMIDSTGEQYLFKEGQVIRRPKPYVNLFTNAAVFY